MSEETLFAEALARSDPAERAAFLEQACDGDVALRQRVEALLQSHKQAGSLLDKPAADLFTASSPSRFFSNSTTDVCQATLEMSSFWRH